MAISNKICNVGLYSTLMTSSVTSSCGTAIIIFPIVVNFAYITKDSYEREKKGHKGTKICVSVQIFKINEPIFMGSERCVLRFKCFPMVSNHGERSGRCLNGKCLYALCTMLGKFFLSRVIRKLKAVGF